MSRTEDVSGADPPQRITYEEVKEFTTLLWQMMDLARTAKNAYLELSADLQQRNSLLERALDEGFTPRALLCCIRVLENCLERPKETRTTRFNTSQNYTLERIMLNNEKIRRAHILAGTLMLRFEGLSRRFVALGRALAARATACRNGRAVEE